MVAMSAVHSTPPIDDYVRAEVANDADHVLKNLIAPDFFGFLRSFRKSKIFRAREIDFHAVPARGGKKLLRSNQSQLRRLFRTEVILPALTAGQGKQSHIGVQTAREIGQGCAGFIIRMRGDIEDR